MLTIDSITETQLEGMDEDNPLSEDDQAKNALPADEKALLDRCSGEVMLFRLKGPLSFGAAKGISERMMLVRNYKVPYSVVSGFMSGIGVIIIALQIGPLLGISTRGGVVESLTLSLIHI